MLVFERSGVEEEKRRRVTRREWYTNEQTLRLQSGPGFHRGAISGQMFPFPANFRETLRISLEFVSPSRNRHPGMRNTDRQREKARD